MSTYQKKSLQRKAYSSARIFFRHFPGIPYTLKWLAISVLIGTFVGSASAFFLKSLDWVTNFRESHIWIIWLLPVAGFLIGLLYYYFGKEAERGNNLIIESIHTPGKKIPFIMAPLVFIGTLATHLFGGSAGREGTAIQMAGAISDQFSKPLKLNESDRRILIIAAIAAGFGSVFGTPLAGAVFGMEVFLTGRLKYDAIFPAFLSALIADLVTRLWNAHHTAYHIDIIPALTFLNIIYAIIAGIIFGICSALFSKAMHSTTSVFQSKVKFAPLRPVAGGAVVSLAVFAIGTTKYIGLGIPAITQSFAVQQPPYDFAIKIAFTIITLSAGFKGGEVTPLFCIGALLGSALSMFIPLPVALLAGMGFVAVFSGATNTPIACSIMAIELFGIECGAYAAIACVTSYLLSGNNSIYKAQVLGQSKHSRFINYEGKRFGDL